MVPCWTVSYLLSRRTIFVLNNKRHKMSLEGSILVGMTLLRTMCMRSPKLSPPPWFFSLFALQLFSYRKTNSQGLFSFSIQRYEEEINRRVASENQFVELKKVSQGIRGCWTSITILFYSWTSRGVCLACGEIKCLSTGVFDEIQLGGTYVFMQWELIISSFTGGQRCLVGLPTSR